MPKSLFISILIVTSFKLSVAAILSPRKFYDTAINPKIAATLTKKELSIIFGRDDSSKDLIQFYFAKRNKEKNDAHPGFYLRKPDCIDDNRSDFRITATNNKWADGYSKKVDDPYPVIISLILCPLIPFLIIGQRLRTKYSLNKLFIQLNSNFVGKTIPKLISKSHSFKKILRSEYQK